MATPLGLPHVAPKPPSLGPAKGDFDEFSISEIAERLRLTREAVKSRIYRGRQMVQEYLRD